MDTQNPKPELVEQLKVKHGPLYQLTTKEGVSAVFKGPDIACWKQWKAQTADDVKKLVASTNLVNACLVWPEQATFDALVAKQPFAIDSFCLKLLAIGGMDDSVEKKLL